jgi:predicted dehydrogenase
MSVRIGVLGAARITRLALISPARKIERVSVDAVAARNPDRAHAYAARHGIQRVHSTYEELLADPAIDAVYVPLPPALHGAWSIAALEAGKHVLVEKPFTSNAFDAQRVADSAGDRVLMEAFHPLYHPLVGQVREVLDSGELGTVTHATGWHFAPIAPGRDIRWNAELGGGALMDLGCYPVRMLQHLFGYDATVLEASASMRNGVDATMTATLGLPGGVTATVAASLWSRRLLGSGLTIIGSQGHLRVGWPFLPQLGGRIRIRSGRSRTVRALPGSSYGLQLIAFRDAIESGAPLASVPDQSIHMMRVIDDIYLAAGMAPRQPIALN